MIRLIVGLGNPGKEYERTRHNLGFLAVKAFAARFNLTLTKERKFLGWAAKGVISREGRDSEVHLLLPATYMNLSGQAVRKIGDFYKIAPQELLVVCDDIALPFGSMRLKPSGSAGGHNGLKDVEACLGTLEYPRLRMGIGDERDIEGEAALKPLADYVLERFTKEEEQQLDEFIGRAVEVIARSLTDDITALMGVANVRLKRSEPHKEG